MSNGNRNNVAECGSDTVASVSESRKAQEGDVEWIWETLGDSYLSSPDNMQDLRQDAVKVAIFNNKSHRIFNRFLCRKIPKCRVWGGVARRARC